MTKKLFFDVDFLAQMRSGADSLQHIRSAYHSLGKPQFSCFPNSRVSVKVPVGSLFRPVIGQSGLDTVVKVRWFGTLGNLNVCA